MDARAERTTAPAVAEALGVGGYPRASTTGAETALLPERRPQNPTTWAARSSAQDSDRQVRLQPVKLLRWL